MPRQAQRGGLAVWGLASSIAANEAHPTREGQMIIAALSVAAVLAGAAPSVSNGVLTLAPGETAVVALSPGGPKLVDEGEGVRLKFMEMEGVGGPILMVENGYDRPVDYEARMFNEKGDSAKTSICTVLPHIFVSESWPHPI